jgi:acetoacetyl-CoA synthetase
MAEMLWKPSDESIRQSNMHRFMQCINSKYNQKFTHYAPLYAWSVRNIADFWASLWEFADILHSKPYDQVVDDLDKMPGARWFPGAQLNFAENLLRHRDGRTALIFKGEGQPSVKITYAQLYDEVARIAQSLRALGIKPGDRVVGFIPNMPQAIIAMLAATSIGAIWSSCSPDFGIKGVLDRFGQIQPRVIFTADGYFFKGKKIDSLGRMASILKELRSIERVVVVPYTDPAPDIRGLPNALGGFSGHGSRPSDPVRATALRASALHHVLLRHHGPAEVHGAERGRHPRPSSEGVDASHQPHPFRHHFLLHHLRLDDVELVDKLAGGGCDTGAL